MIRLLWIPLAGTIAALIVVLWAHEPREEEPPPLFPEPPPTLHDDGSDAPAPEDDEEAEDTPGAETKEPPAPPPSEHYLRLEKDGTLVDLDSSRTFADVAAVVAVLAKDERVRNRIFLSNGADVQEAELDRTLESLRGKFEVRKVYRAPEEDEK